MKVDGMLDSVTGTMCREYFLYSERVPQHPDICLRVPSATTGVEDGGRGHNGGVWEWISTVFDKHEGFEPSRLYPGFSADFFDTLHNVVVCGILITLFF
jgi:hypothetical protein